MNSVQLVGRFTRDPDIRYTNGGSSIARFSLAVGRIYKQENGPDADFISCVAFGKTAEFIEKYFHKGQRIGVTGRIRMKTKRADISAENASAVPAAEPSMWARSWNSPILRQASNMAF